MNIYIKLLLIATIVVFVVDISGVMTSIRRALQGWLDRHYNGMKVGQLKPWSCSLCMVHHVCLIYAICVGEFSVLVWAYICLLAALSRVVAALYRFIVYALDTALCVANSVLDYVINKLH